MAWKTKMKERDSADSKGTTTKERGFICSEDDNN